MPVEINLTEDDIAYAESVLLPKGASFDHERREFIRNLGTLDLQAVPGSGKTTALLAKLLILDRYLPFADGSGILVLSHTNAAIDEIRSRIGSHCKALFRYPNFVGTIQGFVDDFLAIPYFTNRYHRVPVRIDDEIREQRFANRPFNMQGFSAPESKRALHFLRVNSKPIRLSYMDGNTVLTEGYRGPRLIIKKPRGNTKAENYSDWSLDEKAKVEEWVTKFTRRVLASGHLCYDDAYFLADVFLTKNSQIKELLQARFSHVFVDEMQDMEMHQHDLLERVFFDGGSAVTAFQRVGDKNQSIYDGRTAATQGFWIDRATVLQLNGSYRLSPLIAELVSNFAIAPLRIDGRGKNSDGSEISVRPKFIVYSESTLDQVLPEFTRAIREGLDNGSIPADPHNKYRAIAWATKPDNEKVRLCSYHPSFSREELRQKPDYTNLRSYILACDKRSLTFASAERGITGAMLQVLRIEGIGDASGRPLNKAKLKEFLVGADPESWAAHEANLYRWCVLVASGKEDDVVQEMKSYLPKLLALFDSAVKLSAAFINDTSTVFAPPVSGARRNGANIFQGEGVNILVSTVHAVKGETHTATLYMETHYEKGGGGSYESERLAKQLIGTPLAQNAHKLAKQSAKMVYVGFSRPTHLLCFAVHESRFTALAVSVNTSGWDVLRLVDKAPVIEQVT
ncbi:UvrD-helicase domain-containing protein [Duganella levis]|uniref:UvrD-helicase domain-containing protein n=1 Tax=Duganella levis TaxID=2692169 RepID=A0ABW9VZ90_9BURK|nr:UvrD-helicase domain-containing protein [Duganella levis]MYN26974.1 UvrD-helicase domain-containing protein [Duganella levis]